MTDKQYTDIVMQGHFLYWDMLGDLRGTNNHREENLRWLTGGIDYTYFTGGVEINETVKRMKNGEIPNNLLFFAEGGAPDKSDPFLASGLFKKNSETIGMAHELCDTVLPGPDTRINLFRVREISQLKTAGAILNTVFDYRLFSFGNFLEMFENDRQYFYLAEYDGLPVSAVMSQHGDGFVNISWAGTLPGYRKLGIAGYLIQMAEHDGLTRGKTIGTLHGYPDIAGTYRRLGYREYNRGTGLALCE